MLWKCHRRLPFRLKHERCKCTCTTTHAYRHIRKPTFRETSHFIKRQWISPGCCPARERRTSRTSPNGFGHADLSITSQASDPGLRLWLSSNYQSHLRRNWLRRSDKSRACSIYCDANVKWISAATSINYSPTTKSAPPKRLAKLFQACSHTAVDKMALRCPPTPASFSQVVSPSSMCRASSVKTTPLIWEVSSGWKKMKSLGSSMRSCCWTGNPGLWDTMTCKCPLLL